MVDVPGPLAEALLVSALPLSRRLGARGCWLALLACAGCGGALDGPIDAGRDGASDASGDASGDASAPHDASAAPDAALPHPDATIVERGSCGAACTQLTVTCGGRALAVDVRTREPSGPVRATVLFGTGGVGDSFTSDVPAMGVMLDELRALGFRVVERRWGPPGWFAGTNGVYASSCAYAALLGWIAAQHPDAPLCATGHSGGAMELGYALARWDASRLLDAAIFAGGPSTTDLARVCPGSPPPAWTSVECPGLADRYLPDHASSCPTGVRCSLSAAAAVVDSAYGGETVCTVGPGTDRLADDGIVVPDGLYAYPHTAVSFLVGEQECASTFLLLVDRVGLDASAIPPRTLTIVPRTPHELPSTAEGVAATRAAVLATCGAP